MLKLGACIISCALAGGAAVAVTARTHAAVQDDDSGRGRSDSANAELARQLSDANPLVRQHAAEELARRVAVDQMKMVEGYRREEKNGRVKLALDWALFRMGRRSALFSIVHALDSSHSNQAEAYLAQLEGPEPLYMFLDHENSKIQAKLLETLGRIGDAKTRDVIEPYMSSTDQRVADAARFATREITLRLSSPAENNNNTSRPRRADPGSESEP